MENTATIKKTKHKRNNLQAVSVPTEVVFHIILILFSLFCIIPFVFIVIISLSAEYSIRQIGYSFTPLAWSIDAYKYIFQVVGRQLWISYANSFYVTIVGTFISLVMTVSYAYILFRRDFVYRNFFSFFVFFTMLFGGGLVPTWIMTKTVLHLGDTRWALIIPALISPFYVIIMRTFFQTSVPEELIEAAQIDGSGEYRTLLQIVLPISKPGIATIGLLTALGYWNDWMLAMYYVRDNNKIPLQYLLMQMQNNADFIKKNAAVVGASVTAQFTDTPSLTMRMAIVVFIVLPIACAYPFFQRYIIAGLTVGSVKG